ncbi:MAG: hypothetical protein KI791_08555 [Cyclobacteriaceae bacterium]|nr:hypothetical protein [Cyclobacteriaceae bacterium SS2]
MTFTDKHIVKTYSKLFKGLNEDSKVELIENLSKSLKSKKERKEAGFYESFGSFESEKTANEIIAEIKSSRKFREKDIEL